MISAEKIDQELIDLAWELCDAVRTSYEEDAFGKTDERLKLEDALNARGFKHRLVPVVETRLTRK